MTSERDSIDRIVKQIRSRYLRELESKLENLHERIEDLEQIVAMHRCADALQDDSEPHGIDWSNWPAAGSLQHAAEEYLDQIDRLDPDRLTGWITYVLEGLDDLRDMDHTLRELSADIAVRLRDGRW